MTQPSLFRKRVAHMILYGHCPCKKSLYRRGRGGHLFLNKPVKDQINALTLQVFRNWLDPPCKHPNIQVRFFVRDQRPDRDGKWTTILDCLQKGGVLRNDNIAWNNGVVTHWPAVIDKNERVELVLSYD